MIRQQKIDTRTQQILNIIDRAEKSTNIKLKFQILDTPIKGNDNQRLFSTRGETMGNRVGQLPPELAYKNKLAHLYYSIRYYNQAKQLYSQLYHSTNNAIFTKGKGDCLRHLQKYDEAIKCYKQGLEFCDGGGNSQLKHQIYNSMGLTYTQKNNYDQAIEYYKLAIKLASNNPLYYCNMAAAYLKKGEKQKALGAYYDAQDIFKKSKLDDLKKQGLSEQNIKYIEKTLNSLVDNLKELFTIKIADEELNQRIYNIPQLTKDSYQNPDNPQIVKRQAQRIKQGSEVVGLVNLKGNINLKDVRRGMVQTLYLAYSRATIVHSEIATIQSGTTLGQIATKIATYLPIIGNTLSTVIDSADKLISISQITTQTCNILKMADDSNQFSRISDDFVNEFIMKNQKALQVLRTNNLPQPRYLGKLMRFFKKTKEQIQKQIYGERLETDLQRYGGKIATDVVSRYIANSQILKQGQKLSWLQYEDKVDRLRAAADKIFQEDRVGERTELGSNRKNPENPIEPQKKTWWDGCCSGDSCSIY